MGKIFFQPEGYTLEDIKDAKNIFYVWTEIKWNPFFREKVQPWFPKMKYRLSEKCGNYLERIENKRVLGVLFRGTDYSEQRPFGHYIQPDLDTTINMTQKKMEEWGAT